MMMLVFVLMIVAISKLVVFLYLIFCCVRMVIRALCRISVLMEFVRG